MQLSLEFDVAFAHAGELGRQTLRLERDLDAGRHLVLGERHQLDDAVAQRLRLRVVLLAEVDELVDEVIIELGHGQTLSVHSGPAPAAVPSVSARSIDESCDDHRTRAADRPHR